MEELVSVVIPVYNAEKFLDRCLKSIVSQTYKELEIILVNDGSSDSSPDICKKWAQSDSRIKIINKENAGAGMARNDGIASAAGKYIMFVDSDDYMDEKVIEKSVNAAKQDDADVVMFGICRVFASGKKRNEPVVTSQLLFEGESVVEEILSGLFIYEKGIGISVWGKLFRIDKIRENGIFFKSERELFSEDAHFLLELFKRIERVKIIPENLYFYCDNENSVSRTYNKEHIRLNDAFLTQSISLCERYSYPQRVIDCIKVRYTNYAMAGMKQLILADIPTKERQEQLKKFFKNRLLNRTVGGDVLKHHTVQSKIFWVSFKLKFTPLCRLMLMLKLRKKEMES